MFSIGMFKKKPVINETAKALIDIITNTSDEVFEANLNLNSLADKKQDKSKKDNMSKSAPPPAYYGTSHLGHVIIPYGTNNELVFSFVHTDTFNNRVIYSFEPSHVKIGGKEISINDINDSVHIFDAVRNRFEKFMSESKERVRKANQQIVTESLK